MSSGLPPVASAMLRASDGDNRLPVRRPTSSATDVSSSGSRVISRPSGPPVMRSKNDAGAPLMLRRAVRMARTRTAASMAWSASDADTNDNNLLVASSTHCTSSRASTTVRSRAVVRIAPATSPKSSRSTSGSSSVACGRRWRRTIPSPSKSDASGRNGTVSSDCAVHENRVTSRPSRPRKDRMTVVLPMPGALWMPRTVGAPRRARCSAWCSAATAAPRPISPWSTSIGSFPQALSSTPGSLHVTVPGPRWGGHGRLSPGPAQVCHTVWSAPHVQREWCGGRPPTARRSAGGPEPAHHPLPACP